MKRIISITTVVLAFISQAPVTVAYKVPPYESPLKLEEWHAARYVECIKDCDHVGSTLGATAREVCVERCKRLHKKDKF